jgi:hypothetical protein
LALGVGRASAQRAWTVTGRVSMRFMQCWLPSSLLRHHTPRAYASRQNDRNSLGIDHWHRSSIDCPLLEAEHSWGIVEAFGVRRAALDLGTKEAREQTDARRPQPPVRLAIQSGAKPRTPRCRGCDASFVGDSGYYLSRRVSPGESVGPGQSLASGNLRLDRMALV